MSPATVQDLRWLDAAVRYATPYLGTTADNPAVAALIVDPQSQTLLARAVTAKGGRPHAESQALETAGFEAAGRTLYVTLEPCHHWGRTPPCVDAVIRSGVMRVVIGARDPDPRLSGESVRRLESAGIEVVLADHAPSAQLHAGHNWRLRSGRPFVTAWMAVSADGMIGRLGEGSVAIVGDSARDWTHVQRSRADAILIDDETARRDDPQLTVRLAGLERRSPLRVILAGPRGIDRKANLVGGFSGYRTAIIAETDVMVDAPVSVEVIRTAGVEGRPDLTKAFQALGGRGIQNLLVEPSGRLATALVEADLVDRFALLTSPNIIGNGGMPAGPDGRIEDLLASAGLAAGEVQPLGEDTLTLFQRPA